MVSFAAININLILSLSKAEVSGPQASSEIADSRRP